jgi:phosphate-selective porin OprO/OprP
MYFFMLFFLVNFISAATDLEKRVAFLEQELANIKKSRPRPIIKGFILQDYAAFSVNDQMKAGLNPATKDSSGLRRAHFGVAGKYNEKISYNFCYDFARSSNVEPRQVFLKYRGKSGRALFLGHTKEPFGLESINLMKNRVFMEPAVSVIFSPCFNSGLLLTDENTNRKFSWSFGLFNDDTNNDARTGFVGSANWNRTLRAVYTPVYKNGGRQVLHLGGAYSYRNSNGTNLRFRGKPESSLWNINFVDSGNMIADNAELNNLEFAWVRGPFSMQAEFVNAELKPLIGGAYKFSGHYVMASYFLTGEHRNYNRESRIFGLVKPAKGFTDGGRGAWELAVRHSQADLNSGPVAGGEISNWTLGLNWTPIKDTRIMWNYVRSDLERAGSAESINMRLQFEF